MRADMENRVGGPFSWNTGVDYLTLYNKLDSRRKAEVKALYKSSGASLRADLDALNGGTRVAPSNPTAISQMDTYAELGDPEMPIFTMHTTSDNVVFTSEETVYRARVDRNHKAQLLRQTYVAAAGHCTFSASEQVAALLTIRERLSTGHWPTTTATAMNARAAKTRLDRSTFVQYTPPICRDLASTRAYAEPSRIDRA